MCLAEDPEVAKVKEWRHKLQKAFLNTKAEPKEEVRLTSTSLLALTMTPRDDRICPPATNYSGYSRAMNR